MKMILLYLLFFQQIFAQEEFLNIPADTVPPFQIGNKWYFNVQIDSNGIKSHFLMTKEIIDTLPDNKYIISINKYFENNTVQSVEYWFWFDSSYSQSQNVNQPGPILYKIGQENYYKWLGFYLYEYYNISVSIFNILSGGAIYKESMRYHMVDYWWVTKFALKIGLLEDSYYFSSSEYPVVYKSSEHLIAIKINNIFYGDSTNLFTDVTEQIQTVNDFQLFQNFPNPFNPNTLIKYSIPNTSFVSLKIFNVLGDNIATLVNSEIVAGNYQVEFNPSNISSGIYFYRLEYAGNSITKKMIFLK